MLPPAPGSPRRYTCIAYADIDTVYLVFPSSPPRALFFVVTAEVIPSGRNPLPGIFKLSKYEIAHQARSIESPDRLLQPSASTYIRIRLSLVPWDPVVHLVLSHSWLTRIATIRTTPRYRGVTLVTAPTPVTVSTLVTVGQLSSARSVISLAWDVPVSPLFSLVLSHSLINPEFGESPNSSTNTARRSFKRRKFCRRSKDIYLISCHYYIVCKLFVAARNPSFETIPAMKKHLIDYSSHWVSLNFSFSISLIINFGIQFQLEQGSLYSI